jgi:copper chaperone CopZ
MESTVTLFIDGMHCEACVRGVFNALAEVEGVQVECIEVGSAWVAFDSANTSATSAEQIPATLDRIGFTARIDNQEKRAK